MERVNKKEEELEEQRREKEQKREQQKKAEEQKKLQVLGPFDEVEDLVETEAGTDPKSGEVGGTKKWVLNLAKLAARQAEEHKQQTLHHESCNQSFQNSQTASKFGIDAHALSLAPAVERQK